ncbi:DUF3828 domain-containing protein [Kosakonia pseudosacchari]|uniref:DUF3828 domain-containing protein n=1 Tax=Kosakonia pseudosacchari TaxID=1646340 RepID=UPI0022F007F3|nr:DUF3828 domain-containing protein [Kosakonia pseudosacchari]WBU50070.1 DUF3828 domain-containing protein [Kosakonia pseudosacchari]
MPEYAARLKPVIPDYGWIIFGVRVKFKGRYICNWHSDWVNTDVDYFTKSQDIYPSWKASISTFDVSQKENDSSVNVILGAGFEPKFKVMLERIDGKRKITSVTEQ